MPHSAAIASRTGRRVARAAGQQRGQGQREQGGEHILEPGRDTAADDGPAEQAGIPKDAVIVKVDERRIDTGDALIAAIRSYQPGDTVKVTYTDANGRNEKSVDVTLAEAPGGR